MVPELVRMNCRHLLQASTIVLLLTGATAAATPPDTIPRVEGRPSADVFLSVARSGSLVPDPAILHEQVREPLFAWVFSLIAADSLGAWTIDDITDFAAIWGEESDFPLIDYVEGVTREALPKEQVRRRRGVVCDRVWTVRLRSPRVEAAMPYSILGYHPGKLSFGGPIVLHEWSLGDRSVHVTVDRVTRKYAARALTVLEISDGWIILDVDGWLDRLLGKAADDALTEGFIVGWVDGELVGVGNSAGRDGHRIFGELNFRTGEIENHGRPVARGISRYSRAWTRADAADPQSVWRAYEQ